ncbi:hypothetical protein IWQ62_005709 [Dispira parvispora]|uniref:Uncharacterized protein n=1 Tax=Dispira parvispora TaxID=1520584 RepID=A0A9W8AJW4_9FUNG|nr:hypothetical protein IWQ62_005709 [Dispira parvispora]
MDDKVQFWRDTSLITKDAGNVKSARVALQPKLGVTKPLKSMNGKVVEGHIEATKVMSKKMNDLSQTVQHQQSRIAELEAELKKVGDTMVPKSDMDDIIAENQHLKAELEESNELLRECQDALEASLVQDNPTATEQELRSIISQQTQTIEQLENRLMESTFNTTENDKPPSRKRGYSELQAALDEALEENEWLHKRIALLDEFPDKKPTSTDT